MMLLQLLFSFGMILGSSFAEGKPKQYDQFKSTKSIDISVIQFSLFVRT